MTGVFFNGFPIGIVNYGCWFRRTLRHLHDHLDEFGINPRPVRIINFAGKATDILGMPRIILHEFAAVYVPFRRAFFRCASDNRAAEEAVGLGIQNRFPLIHKTDERTTELAVEHWSTCDNEVVLIPINPFVICFDHVHKVNFISFGDNGFGNPTCDTHGMAETTVINNENRFHIIFSTETL
ncbi:hypothetical protein EVA_09040 [gut metagenome]|uniref:Uncharacterized protein n=1 Tax=gut metagenome TaxID=749906 RepID=J9CRN9_9ZZZZ